MGLERDNLFKLACKSKEENVWIAARKQRQLVNYALKRANATYYKKVLLECRGIPENSGQKLMSYCLLRKTNIRVITNQESNCDPQELTHVTI